MAGYKGSISRRVEPKPSPPFRTQTSTSHCRRELCPRLHPVPRSRRSAIDFSRVTEVVLFTFKWHYEKTPTRVVSRSSSGSIYKWCCNGKDFRAGRRARSWSAGCCGPVARWECPHDGASSQQHYPDRRPGKLSPHQRHTRGVLHHGRPCGSPTYYPGGSAPSAGGLVRVTSGGAVNSIDFRLAQAVDTRHCHKPLASIHRRAQRPGVSLVI